MREWKKWPIGKINNLYYRGTWDEKLFSKTLVVVGSRKMTRYGNETVCSIMPEIVANKVTVVSGFMYGVDTAAHTECIELGGKTIAVLGSGLNYLTTVGNDTLYTRILESGGLVVSEYDPEFVATRWSFPQRNRIVAKLATEGILIVEAGMKSGSLITARLGKEYGKKVYAIPGPIDSKSSEGCNWLIKNGDAIMVTNIGDIFSDTILQPKLFNTDLSNEENDIYELLENEPMSVDEIAKKIRKNVSSVSIVISMMSMKNLIDEELGKVYLKRF